MKDFPAVRDSPVDCRRQKNLDFIVEAFRLSKNVSLRTSPQTGVAISKLLKAKIERFSVYLGDSHASVRSGSE